MFKKMSFLAFWLLCFSFAFAVDYSGKVDMDDEFEEMENDMFLFGIGSKPMSHEKQEEFVAKWKKRMSDIEFLLSEQND